MLITTIPKSAGTALMETLARAHDIPCSMHHSWPGKLCSEFDLYHTQHNFGHELSARDVDELTRPGFIYKTHVLPSSNNLALLRDHPKVVLLRNAEGVVEAYRRGRETGVYQVRAPVFRDCGNNSDWIACARRTGYLQELERFNQLWQSAAGDQLVVHYETLITDTERVCARIEDYFGINRSGIKDLLKRKYTRAGNTSLETHLKTVDSWKSVGRNRIKTMP